ncbi:MAG: hypothetical protein J5883_01915 [Clostridiales bacterium]|nr:hypothetical protein [Clostridiales bacterium]
MKKLTAIIICSALFLTACNGTASKDEGEDPVIENTIATEAVTEETTEPDETEETTVETEDDIIYNAPVVGGWEIASDYLVNSEREAVFDKAVGDLDGVDYDPMYYLGSQVVAGTNHCFLCRASAVVPDPVPYWALVYIYEDLQGEAEITKITILGYDTDPDQNGMVVEGSIPSGQAAGAWEIPVYTDITPEQDTVIDEMCNNVSFELVDNFIGCLGTRVSSGYDYCFLSQVSVPGDTAPMGWELVYICTDADGSFDSVETAVIDLGTLAS